MPRMEEPAVHVQLETMTIDVAVEAASLVPTASQQALLVELRDAVRRHDRDDALRIARLLQQSIASGSAGLSALDREVRALLSTLERDAQAQAAGPADTEADIESLIEIELPSDEGDLGTPRDPGVWKASPRLSAPSLEIRETVQDDAAVLYPVWFGTNRARLSGGGFGTARDAKSHRGRVTVRIPRGHRFGETGSAWWKKLLRFDLHDDTLRLHDLGLQSTDAFYADMARAMREAESNTGGSQALVFIHGFNVSFEEAAIRAAQIGYDLKVPGATAFFSWPSRGEVAAYPADEASIEASERAIADFLVEFAERSTAGTLHVIAHSMGNRGFLRALQRIAADADARSKVKFGQIFLAAPDIDRDLFTDLAHLYGQFARRTTLYASARDLPVHLSAKLHDAPRAGYFRPYTVTRGVDTIAVPDFDIDLLGHSYFAQAEALLHDIFDLMRNDRAPDGRQRLRGVREDDVDFWRFDR